MSLTDYQAKYFAYELTKRSPSDSMEKLAGAVASAQVDLNPHQVDAALFAFRSPLSKGALLADEVGLGKTIEAGLVLSQKWAERRRRILIIVPSNLRKQAKTTKLVVQETIDIPRILVVPKGEVTSGFNSFTLDASSIHYQPVERDILIQHLRTHRQETLTASGNGQTELRLENYLVRALIDFDDISYDDHADLLYDLAGQMVKHLRSYLKDNGEVVNVLQ